MMIKINTGYTGINYNPQNIVEEIKTNVSMILRVFKEEQPLNRDFAFDSDLIDKNSNILRNRIANHLIDILGRYEPRALLKKTQILMKDKNSNDFEIELEIEVVNIG